MKRLLTVLAVLFLTSCLPVDDFGTYKDKFVVDRNLLGEWEEVPDSSRNDGYAEINRMAEENGTIYATCLNCKTQKKEKMSKTLRVGKYSFFVDVDKQGVGGNLSRYQVMNNKLVMYSLKNAAAWEFIEEKYPDQKNIIMTDTSSQSLLAKGLSDPEQYELRVSLFDDKVYEILSHIPDTENYWRIDEQSIRIGNAYTAHDKEKNK